MSDVERAEKTLAGLKQKREALVAHGHSLGEAQGRISYSAHTGDKAARAKLDKLNAEAALHDSELRSLDSAIAEGTARVERARQAEAQAAARQRAEEAQTLVRELAPCFGYLDKHLTEAARALIAIHDGIAKLHAAGFSFPSDAQLRLGITTVLQSWAHGLPRSLHDQLRDGFEFLAPGRRQTASEYWAAISPSLNNQITQRLSEPEAVRVREDA
jgi:hypothetical protein